MWETDFTVDIVQHQKEHFGEKCFIRNVGRFTIEKTSKFCMLGECFDFREVEQEFSASSVAHQKVTCIEKQSNKNSNHRSVSNSGKLIAVMENLQKYSATNTHLVSSRKPSLENDVTHAVNAGSLLTKATAPMIIGGFTLVKSLMSVANVGNPVGRAVVSFSTRELTLE
jgi:hypothetical protein